MTIIDTYCGLSCAECDFKESCNCGGCIESLGNPFHGECSLAKCAITKNKRFCGECESFPCELLTHYSFDPEHGDNGERIESCKKLKSTLVREARVDLNPVSICGHHCDHCFLGQWCGGCRSDYNCCSFAILCEDGVCPNVKCAGERGLSSCSACAELSECRKGYYGVRNEYVAKATALFIHRHGEACYTNTLMRAIDSGLNYPKSFDEAGSVPDALVLLEEYL